MIEHEQAAFRDFRFKLGQRVQHRVTEHEGVVVQRWLVQNQHGGTGHAYVVSYGPDTVVKALEVELEAVEDDGEES